MRTAFTLLIIFLFSTSIFAQAKVTNVPAFDSSFVFSIIKNKPDLIRAIFDWVAKEVDYDMASLEDLPTYSHPSELLDSVWENRSGVCMHYAELMNAFCQKAGYESVVINGYTMNQREVDRRYGHSWNAVKVNGTWCLYDATWAAGYRRGKRFIKKYDPKWYNVKPSEFIYSHVPFDPVWQLLDRPLSSQEITKKTVAATHDSLSFQTIIAQQKHQDPIEKDRIQLARIRAFEDDNPLVIREIERIENNIEIQVFKRGVDSYNSSIDSFNGFIAHYNRGFSHAGWTDEELQQIVKQVNDQLKTAETNFTTLDPENPIYSESLANNLQLMKTYKQRVKALNGFAYRYLKTWRIFRWLVRLEG